MKKLFLMMTAVAAMLATSCVQDVAEDVQISGAEGVVLFSVEAPELGSRAEIGDGTKASHLEYVVYDAQWSYLTEGTATFNADLKATIELRLVNNKEYNFAFWASVKDNDYYTFDKNAATVTVDYSGKANDENRDAFFGQLTGLVVNGTMNESVKLYRPFAQVNWGTNDVAAAKTAGFDISTTGTVVYEAEAYTTLNLKNGAVDGLQAVTFTAADLVSNTGDKEQLETKEHGNYTWLSMNYLLWTADQGTLTSNKITITDDKNQQVVVSYPNANVRRNWRTNLVGALLTDQTNIVVEILPGFADQYDVELWDGQAKQPAVVNGIYQINDAAELAWFFGKKMDKSAILLNDINLAGLTVTPINGGIPVSSMSESGRQVFDGNGKTISNFTVSTTDMSGGLFATLTSDTVKNLTIDGATVVVDGNGEQYAAIVAGKAYGQCVFENVTVKNSKVDGINKVGAIVGHIEDAELTIANCTIENTTVENHEVGTRAANPDAEVGLAGMAVGYINADFNSTIEVAIKGCTMNVTNGRGNKDRANGKIVGGIQGNGKVTINATELDVELNEEANGYESVYGSLVGAVRSGTPTLTIEVEDVLATWPATFAEALNKGGVIGLVAGEYDLPRNIGAANLTLRGLGDKTKVVLNAKQSVSFGNSAVINFENVTYKVPYGLWYDEHQHGFLHFAKQFNMTGCLIDGGHLRLNVQEGNIEECEFVVPTSSGWDGYAIHYYGTENSTLNVKKSKFTTAGKAICIFSEGPKAYNLNVEECEFTSSNPATDKAAIQMHSEWGIWGNVNITKSTATGFAAVNGGLWNDVNNGVTPAVPNNKFNVTVDGEVAQVAGLTLVAGYKALATNAEGEYCLFNTQSIADWHDFAKANLYTKTHGVTYKLLNDIDAKGYVWESMWLSESRNGMVIDGNNHTISNLVTNGGLFGGTASGYNGTAAVVKNLTFANLSTVSGHWNAAIWGALYGDMTLENVKVVDSELTGKCNVGAFIAGAANENFNKQTVIFKDCQVLNSKLVGEGYASQDPTGASGFMGRAFNNLYIEFKGTNVVDDATVITNENGLVGGRVYGYTIYDNGFKGTGACDGFVNLAGVNYVETADLSVLAPEGSNEKTVAAGTTVVLTDDISNPAGSGGYGVAGLTVAGGVLDGNGHTLTITGANGTWDTGVYHRGGTIKNLTVGGSFRGIFTAGCSSDINVENVVIDNVCYCFSSDTANPNYSVNFKNVVLNGWTSFTSGYKSVNFTDCTFSQGTGGYKYAYCRPYQATTFTNCDFNDGATDTYAIDSDCGVVLTFVNCRYNGVALTAENVGNLVNNVANVVIK